MVFCVRVRTFEVTEWVFCSVLLESTLIRFLLVNKEIKVISGKSKFEGEEFLLLQDEHIIVFCVFTFRVDYEMYSLLEMKSTFVWEKMNSL